MEQMMIDVENGKYAIHLQALKKDVDEPSAMSDYLSQMAVVNKQEASLTLSLLFQSQQTVTGFQIQDTDGRYIEAVQKQVNAEMDRRFEMFQLIELPAVLQAKVQYEVEHEGKTFKGDEPLRLSFTKDSLEKIDHI